MKNLIILITLALALTTSTSTTAQIRASIYQDMKLLVMKDDAGNTPPTADILVTARLYAGGTRTYNWTHEIFVYPSFEYADLQDSRYLRYALGIGYSFRNKYASHGLLYIGRTEIFDVRKLSISPSFDFGMVDRWGATAMSWNLATSMDYELTDSFALSLMGSFTKRPHLEAAYNTTAPVFNAYLGITYLFNN